MNMKGMNVKHLITRVLPETSRLAPIGFIMGVLFFQVFSIWDYLFGGGEDPGHAGSEHTGEEVGLVRRYCAHRALCSWTCPPSSLLLPSHQEEPLQLYPWPPAGHGHRPGNLLQVSPTLTCFPRFS